MMQTDRDMGVTGSLTASLTETFRLLHGMESELPNPVWFHSCQSCSVALAGGEH